MILNMLYMESIDDKDFPEYWRYSVVSWITDMTNAGLMNQNISYEEAEVEVKKFIPDGLRTPGHFFFHLKEGEKKVGTIWFEVRVRRGIKEAYLWDIFINADQRGKGYGKTAMHLLEDFVKEKEATKISLNVFASNTVARKLYDKTGYHDAAITMIKDL